MEEKLELTNSETKTIRELSGIEVDQVSGASLMWGATEATPAVPLPLPKPSPLPTPSP